MVSVVWLRLLGATCALLMSWLCGARCAAQHDAHATVRSELANVTAQRSPQARERSADPHARANDQRWRAWLVAAASTSAVLATGFVVTETLAHQAEQRARESARAHELTGGSLRGGPQSTEAQARADLMQRVSSICLAGSVAATGTTLLIWLTSKRKRAERQSRTLLGPMVLRGANGGGLVLREKF